MDRRSFLKFAVLGGTACTIGSGWVRVFAASAGTGPYGALAAADANGIQLPPGFSSRVIATTGQVVPGTSYPWHAAPDGGATFATADGGWIYVSNMEATPGGAGDGALRPRRADRGRPPHPERHEPQLRRGAHPLGHVALVRGDGGEGAWYDTGKVYFTTKGDNRVWTYDPAAASLTVLYHAATSPTPVLTGVDNVTVAPSGDVYVAEAGGNMELVILSPEGDVAPFLRIAVAGSELTGPAFDPSGTRLYFSSQHSPGRTYEITGPFRPSVPPPTTTTTTVPTTTTTTAPPTSFTLTATTRLSGKKRTVELRWSGATGRRVEIRRDGAVVATTANDGLHSDTPGRIGTFRYRVDETGGGRLSHEVTVTV